jgi:hypothetical protein
MLHRVLGNPTPWHGHYYCGLALVLLVATHLILVRFFKADKSAGLSLCTVAVVSYMVKVHLTFAAIANEVFLFCWGIRLVIKGVPASRHEIIQASYVQIVMSQTTWVWLLSAPTVFAVSMNADDFYAFVPFFGVAFCMTALLVECFETQSLDGRLCRNPYTFCSLCMSWGLFLTIPFISTLVFPIIFSCIVIFGPGGMFWTEAKRRSQLFRDAEAREYQRVTSPLIPMPPGWYETIPRQMKKFCCLDY